MDYGEHLARKCSTAVALAVLKSKPPDMATQEYVIQLQNRIKSSFDKLMDIDEISISSQDFEDIEDTMTNPAECGSFQNVQSYSQLNTNNLTFNNFGRNVPQPQINPTIETLNETEKNTYVIPDGASEMYEECGQRFEGYSQITEMNQSNVNMAKIYGYNTVNNGDHTENTTTNINTKNSQPDDQIGLDDIMFSQSHWKDKLQVSTENSTHPQPKIGTMMNDQETSYIQNSTHISDIQKNKLLVSTQQKITHIKNKVPSQSQNIVPSQSQNMVPSQSQHVGSHQSENIILSQSQYMVPSHNQNMIPCQSQHVGSHQSENIVLPQSQYMAPSYNQNMVPSQSQHVGSHQSENIILSQSQYMVPSYNQNMIPCQSQHVGSHQSENIILPQSQYMAPSYNQNIVPSQNQHVGSHQSENIVLPHSQYMVPSHNQNMVACQSEDMAPLPTRTVNERLQQTQNMFSQQINCIEMLSQAITKPDIEINDDIDMECEKDASKGVPFKIIMDMNQVKHALSRIDNAQDSGYRSDSQLSASCRSRNTGSLLSDGKLNQAAHTLVQHLYACSAHALEHPVTSEVSATVAQLVDTLHGVRSYPTFLDELLECVGTAVEEMCNGDSSGGDALLKKEESLHRLALLSESMEITTYAIDKLLDSLEAFHHRLTKDPEGTYEVANIDDMENQCYAFHALETLIVKYLSKKGKDCENQDLDLIQQTVGDPSPTQTDLPSSITELWRRRWDPNYKPNTAQIKSKPLANITNRCGVVLKKFIVGCMDGYSLIAYSALECFNCLQP